MEDLEAKKDYHSVVDEIEFQILSNEHIECPIRHYFTKGLYCREMFVPQGTILTSKLHNSEHPYIISMGSVSVINKDKNGESVLGDYFQAPYFGITYPGTRRVIYAHEDTIWTTIHPTSVVPKSDSEEDVISAALEVEELIIDKHENKLVKNKKEELLWHS